MNPKDSGDESQAYLSVSEVAHRTDLTRAAVRELARHGKFVGAWQPGRGRPWKIPRDSVDVWDRTDSIGEHVPPLSKRWWANLLRYRPLATTAVVVVVLGALASAAPAIKFGLNLLERDEPQFPVAKDGETLVVIATFVDPLGSFPHREIRDSLEDAASELGLGSFRVEIADDVLERGAESEARDLGQSHGAAMVVWGEDTRVNVIARFVDLRAENVDLGSVRIEQNKDQLSATSRSSDPYSTFITDDLPNHVDFLVLYAAGRVISHTDPEAATKIIETALEALGNRPVDGVRFAYARLGLIYSQDEATRELALERFTQALQRDERYFEALYNRGSVYSDLDRFELALADFDSALALDPEPSAAAGLYYNIGNVHLRNGAYQLALESYDTALSRDKSTIQGSALHNRAVALMKLGKIEEALDGINDAVSAEPDEPLHHSTKGEILMVSGDLPMSIEVLGTAIDLGWNASVSPLQLANMYGRRGSAYHLLRNVELAIADQTTAIELDPTVPQYYANRAISFIAIPDRESAMSDLQMVQDLDPQLYEEVLRQLTLQLR